MGKPSQEERLAAIKADYASKGYSEEDWQQLLSGGLSEEVIMWVKASTPDAAVGNQVAWAIENPLRRVPVLRRPRCGPGHLCPSSPKAY